MKVSLEKLQDLLIKKVDLANQNVDSINFQHAKPVFATPDILAHLDEYEAVQDGNAILFVSGSPTNKKDFTDEMVDTINSWYEKFRKPLVTGASILCLIVMLLIIYVVLSCNDCCIGKLFCRLGQRKPRISNQTVTIHEMDNVSTTTSLPNRFLYRKQIGDATIQTQ